MNPGQNFREGFFWSAGAAVFASLTYLAFKWLESKQKHSLPAAQTTANTPCGCK